MTDNDKALLSELEALRTTRGWSQSELGVALSVTQGHLSKVLSGSVKISVKLRVRARNLLDNALEGKTETNNFEAELLDAARTSAPFRALLDAALRMHKNA